MPDPTWPTPEAVEAVARALAEHGEHPAFDGDPCHAWAEDEYRRDARAALAAAEPFIAARETTAKRDAWDEAIRFSIECGNETTDSWGNMYRLDWIARMEHEIEENPYAQEAPHAQ